MSNKKTHVSFGKIQYTDEEDNTLDALFLSFVGILVGVTDICLGRLVRGFGLLTFVPTVWYQNWIKKRTPQQVNLDFSHRISDLATKLNPLPVADFSEFNSEDYPNLYNTIDRQNLINYLDRVLPQTSYLRSKEALEKLDPRLELTYKKEHSLQIGVSIRDSAWSGEPTANTMITGIDFIAEGPDAFQYISDY